MGHFDLCHSQKDSVDHLLGHRSQQVLVLGLRAHVILKAVGTPQVALVGRHQDKRWSLAQRSLMQRRCDLSKVRLLLLFRHLREIAALAQPSDRFIGWRKHQLCLVR